MKKISSMSVLAVAVMSMTGCFGTKSLSSGISATGTVKKENVVFPELEKAWQKDGVFPNSENLTKIRPGVAKDELYQLIGRPHFSERQHAREWDYIMKFYQDDDSVKICQYKVIFDEKYKGQEFYWKPADCAAHVKKITPQAPTVIYQPAPQPVAPVQPVQPAQPQQPIIPHPSVITEQITLAADALFYFDKYKEEDMLPKGKPELDAVARKLVEYQARGRMQVVVTGHTDPLGTDMYNMNLSQLRAQTIRSYLINRGVRPETLMATGAGESQQIKACNMNQPRQALIDCLQPNRRVELSVTVYEYEVRQGPTTYTTPDGRPVQVAPQGAGTVQSGGGLVPNPPKPTVGTGFRVTP